MSGNRGLVGVVGLILGLGLAETSVAQGRGACRPGST